MDKKINTNLLIAGGIITMAYFGGSAILKALGIVDDKDDKAADSLSKESYWDYNKYLNNDNKTKKLLTSSSGNSLSERLYNSKGYFNDDEDAVYDVFRVLETKSQVASLCYWFSKKYNKDLYSYLSSFLSSSELSLLNNIIKPKPNYNV